MIAYRDRRAGGVCAATRPTPTGTPRSPAARWPSGRWQPPGGLGQLAQTAGQRRGERAGSSCQRQLPRGRRGVVHPRRRCRGRARPEPASPRRGPARPGPVRIRPHQGSRSAMPCCAQLRVDERAGATGRAPRTTHARCRGRGCRCRRTGSPAWFSKRCGLPGSSGSKPNWSTSMPGSPSSSRSRSTGGVITPRSSATNGSPSRPLQAVEQRAPGARASSGPAVAVFAPLGNGPVGDEAAEVIDPRDVEQLQRPPHALDPPAVVAPAQRRPVVQRVAPQLPDSVNVSGGAPATKPS